MSKLETLINELCPNGVEYEKIKDITIMKRGISITKSNSQHGDVPVISGGKEPAFYCNTSNRTGETITVAGSGAGAGYVQYWNIPIFANDCFTVKGKEKANTKYIYYCMTNIQEKISDTKKGGGVPHVHIADIENFKVPLPPLQIQEEIVQTLDKFISLKAELKAELKARQQQYEYYRDSLLHLDGERITIQELFDTRNGFTPSKNNSEFWENGSLPWFKLDDINTKGRVLSESYLHITEKALKKSGLFPQNSIIISTSATIGEYALITVPFLCNQRFTCMTLKSKYHDKVNIKYIMHYCPLLSKYCKEHLNQGNFASVDMKKFAQFEFVIPTIEEQERIIAILDRFDKLCNDITIGLPAEIEARQKQYEYYRDKLLNFKQNKGANK